MVLLGYGLNELGFQRQRRLSRALQPGDDRREPQTNLVQNRQIEVENIQKMVADFANIEDDIYAKPGKTSY